MLKTDLIDRLFDGDYELASVVNLTDKEVFNFQNFESACIFHNGLKHINGAFANITVANYDSDEEVIGCYVACGSCDDTGKNTSEWYVNYDRKTETFNEK